MRNRVLTLLGGDLHIKVICVVKLDSLKEVKETKLTSS